MEILAWSLAAVFAALAIWGWVGRREPENPYPSALRSLLAELQRGGIGEGASSEEPEEVGEIRRRLREEWEPRRREDPEEAEGSEEEDPEDPMDLALSGILRYLSEAVLPALEEAHARDDPGEPLRDALDALEDLAFYARPQRDEEPRRENLDQLVQGVTREFTLETGVSLRLRGPDRAIHLETLPETCKDALYLLLSNAGRWGEGQTVDLTLEESEEGVQVRVADRGPGFSETALERAFDPFWSSEADALGLGLTQARQLAGRLGGRITIGNREEGGAEVTLHLPRRGAVS